MMFLFTQPRRARWWCLPLLLALLMVRSALAGSAHDHGLENPRERIHASEKHERAHADDDNHDGEHRTFVRMSPELAEKSGITTAAAAGGDLAETRLLYGRIVADVRLVSRVQARFPGLIVRFYRTLGDTVKAGDVVAEVEANESLRRYDITAPISGVVLAVHGNVGELAGEQPLLTIANHDHLFAEFRLYGDDQIGVAVGQSLRIQHGSRVLDSRVQHLLPATDNEPYMRVMASVDNVRGQWTPGQSVEADLVLRTDKVSLRVDNRALQQIESDTVVFVQQGDRYVIRSLQLGRSDGRFSEVLGGLSAGDIYVVNNSYLLKADLEKSGAAHDH